jgi:hypothetical protein
MPYEQRSDRLLPFRAFLIRMLRHFALALLLLILSLGIGVWGYAGFEHMSPIDALLNASMILGGMGPVAPLQTDGGKLFASFYALYSAFILLTVAGVIFAPVAHRLLHYFHIVEGERDGEAGDDTGV